MAQRPPPLRHGDGLERLGVEHGVRDADDDEARLDGAARDLDGDALAVPGRGRQLELDAVPAHLGADRARRR